MNAEEQINGFQEFLERNYKAELSEKVRRGEKFLVVDFSELSKFDPALADELLEEPEDMIRAAELAIEEFDLQGDIKGFKIRFSNLPESQKIMIRNIRSKHINKLGVMEGEI